MERGVPIRAISRGLAVLASVNRDGPISMMGIARAAEIPYPTACRIVQTLLHEGLIEKEPARKRYRVTSLVQTLSTGFQTEDQLVAAGRPHLESLCLDVGWPVSVATRVGTRMMVRDSTHNMTSLTFSHYYPGYTLPIAECATGKVHLAFCDDEERTAIVEGWKAIETDASRMGMLLLSDDFMLQKIRRDGYAIHARNVYNADPGKTSSIAVPLFGGDNSLIGALALIFFVSAMSADEAAEKYLGPMQASARAIHESLAQEGGQAPHGAEAAE